MVHSLRQLCNICGVDFTHMEEDINSRLLRFKKWCEERRETRRNKSAAQPETSKQAEQVELVENAEDDQSEQVELVEEEPESADLTYEEE